MSKDKLKLEHAQLVAMQSGLEDAIEVLDQQLPQFGQLLSAVLSEVYLEMLKKSITVKPKYTISLTHAQSVALARAKELGFFNSSTYLSITSGMALEPIQRRIAR